MNYLDFTIGLALEAGKLVFGMREKGVDCEEKVENDFVTLADKASEKLIVSKISKEFPEHRVLAEEEFFENHKNSGEFGAGEVEISEKSLSVVKKFLEKYCEGTDYLWIIDPIDGTTNYTRKIPFYCVSIGLYNVRRAEVEVGVVYAPALGELYYAEKGGGAFLMAGLDCGKKSDFVGDVGFQDSQKIEVSKISKLKKAILATGFPPQHKEENLRYFNKVVPLSKSVRRAGSAALDLCYLAAGRLDGFWEFGLKPWDVAAGGLIAIEAGVKIGMVKNRESSDPGSSALNEFDLFAHDILASTPKIFEELKKTLNS